jgi:aldose 1-epimerase
MSINRKMFATLNEKNVVYSFTLKNSQGMSVEILNYGGVIRKICIPDRSGNIIDVVLGYDNFDGYIKNESMLGATVGRLVGIVPDCSLEINGKNYILQPNEPNGIHVHGGIKGFTRSLWEAKTDSKPEFDSVILSLNSPDGDDGYPGEINAEIVYRLTYDGSLEIIYSAKADRDTLYNPTNHCYFNLSGHNSGYIGSQIISVNNYAITKDGSFSPVKNTLFDLNKPMQFTKALDSGDMNFSHGFNNFHMLSGHGMRKVMNAKSPETGCILDVFTDCNAAILYSGYYLNNVIGKNGAIYNSQNGFCFETCFVREEQNFNASHSRIVGPEKPFRSITAYKFFVS